MPLFEYVCQKCGHEFEELVRGEMKVACPSCKSAKVEKKLSVFAAGADSAKAKPEPPCASGKCDAGKCPFSH